MTDHRVRELEREVARAKAARAFTWELQERLELARIRAGGRDPRLDPRAGDYLAGKTTRDVVAVWPRRLAEAVPAHVFDRAQPGDLGELVWLPEGVLILRAFPADRAWARGFVSSPAAALQETYFEAQIGGRWEPFRCLGHERHGEENAYLPLGPGPADGMPPSGITFRQDGSSWTKTVLLDLWRRWARSARVRRTAG